MSLDTSLDRILMPDPSLITSSDLPWVLVIRVGSLPRAGVARNIPDPPPLLDFRGSIVDSRLFVSLDMYM